MTITDRELDAEMVNFLCAYYFHWTPDQTAGIENKTLESLLVILPQWIQKMNEVKLT
jgi:hypothetical protein